jgi:hypothetical protein
VKRALAPFLSRRFTLRSASSASRYLPIEQWVSRTRELALKSPLTASIQAEFNSRADISVYQQSRVNRPQKCRHREESMIPTYSPFKKMVCDVFDFFQFSSRHHSPHICLTSYASNPPVIFSRSEANAFKACDTVCASRKLVRRVSSNARVDRNLPPSLA